MMTIEYEHMKKLLDSTESLRNKIELLEKSNVEKNNKIEILRAEV